jgi:hypothetical protein
MIRTSLPTHLNATQLTTSQPHTHTLTHLHTHTHTHTLTHTNTHTNTHTHTHFFPRSPGITQRASDITRAFDAAHCQENDD